MLEKPLGMETEMSQSPCLPRPASSTYNQTPRQVVWMGFEGDRKKEGEEGGWQWRARGKFEWSSMSTGHDSATPTGGSFIRGIHVQCFPVRRGWGRSGNACAGCLSQEVKLMTLAAAQRLCKLEHLTANYTKKKPTTNCIISKNYI